MGAPKGGVAVGIAMGIAIGPAIGTAIVMTVGRAVGKAICTANGCAIVATDLATNTLVECIDLRRVIAQLRTRYKD